jgi:ketosteroid isomerase-like protein
MEQTELAAKMLHAIANDLDFFVANVDADVVLEFPYAPWVGRAERVVGREDTQAHMQEVVSVLPGLHFTDVRVMPLAEEGAYLLEYVGNCPALNGYRQPYITIMRFRSGKLVLFREYWDTTEIIRVFQGATPASVT